MESKNYQVETTFVAYTTGICEPRPHRNFVARVFQ